MGKVPRSFGYLTPPGAKSPDKLLIFRDLEAVAPRHRGRRRTARRHLHLLVARLLLRPGRLDPEPGHERVRGDGNRRRRRGMLKGVAVRVLARVARDAQRGEHARRSIATDPERAAVFRPV